LCNLATDRQLAYHKHKTESFSRAVSGFCQNIYAFWHIVLSTVLC